MRSILISLVFGLLLVGCTSIAVIPPSTDPEPRTIMLSEMTTELGWTYEEGPGAYDYTATSPQGDMVIFKIGSDVININGTRWQQERDAFEKSGRDLLLPESTFNFVCAHFGRHELLRNTRKSDTVYKPDVASDTTPTPKATVTGTALKGLTICVDAGHGGKDVGGVGFGVYEKDVALNVALKLRELCQAEGAKVIMTRTGDTYPELEDRCTIANNAKADLFISIHANIAPNSDEVTGIEAFYNKNSEPGERFTKDLIAALDAATDCPNRGAKKDPRELRVLQKTKMTASLVELGFLSNENEAKLLATRAYQDKCAKALYEGIAKYWTKNRASVSK
jgi:N-acetylmuramoyl-L-alanine amidase CwlD